LYATCDKLPRLLQVVSAACFSKTVRQQVVDFIDIYRWPAADT
jgi:hypothetical protein